MLKITDRQISNLAAFPLVQQKGEFYNRMGWVQNVKFNKLIKTYKGEIFDDDIYECYVRFNHNDDINSFSCTCLESKRYHGACSHIIALLKYIQTHALRQEIQNEIVTSTKQAIINFQPTSTIKPKKIPLNIEIFLENQNSYYGEYLYTSFLSFKIGLDRMYVLKDFAAFIDATRANTALRYGYQFTYDPIVHEFPDFFKPIYQIIEEIYMITKDTGQAYEFFNLKRFQLPSYYEKKIFELLENQYIHISINDDPSILVKVTTQQPPTLVNVANYEESIDIQFNELDNFIILSSNKDIILYNDTIYILNSKNVDFYAPLLKATQNGVHTLSFDKKEKSNLITKFIPQNEDNLHIPSEIKDKYIKTSLQASLYLDKDAAKLIAKPLFSYGDVSFNPFSREEVIIDNNIYVARDQNKEEFILKQIEDSEFTVSVDNIYIDDDEKIFNFIQNRLPLLQEQMDVYYSDEFKNIITSKTLSSSIRLSEHLDFLEVNFSYDDIDSNELYNIFNSYKKKKKFHRLKDGSFLLLNDERTRSSLEAIDYLDINKKDFTNGTIHLGLSLAPYLKKYFSAASTNDAFEELITKIKNPLKQDFILPEGYDQIARDYQVIGFNWLKTLAYYHLGGILADEMGLGKTLQTIIFLVSEKQQKPNMKTTLIVAPTSLVYNWQAELDKFGKELTYTIVSGSISQRKKQIATASAYNIVITSYPLLRKDAEAYEQLEFEYMFIDEAQYIKNAGSLNAKVTKNMKAKCKFALTGTPIENSLTELWSIFDYILPGFLSNHHRFRTKFENPIIKDKDQEALNELTWMIQPFILRRLKKDVLTELPDKIERKIVIDLNEEQQKLYLSYLANTKSSLAKQIEEKGLQHSRMQILTALMRLRQICCHPSMFLENYHGESAKLETLTSIIYESLEVGHKILVFSQFTSMLGLLKPELDKNNVSYLSLDGSTPMEERGRLVNSFNQGDYDCFLISLKAGGTGLNLTTADVVIHVDPWWNPAVEDQATDRAHRIGQTKIVQVLKLITKGTIEDKIYELQNTKKDLIENIIKPGETFLNALSKEELYKLFDNE